MTLAPAGADRQDPAERLLATVAVACDPTADFPAQLHSAFAATLALLVAEPEVAHRLCDRPYAAEDPSTQDGRPAWMVACAARLRRAARSCPRASSSPLFLEPLLLDGIYWMISERVRVGHLERLPALLPGLLESTLAYYYEPGELGPIVLATRVSG